MNDELPSVCHPVSVRGSATSHATGRRRSAGDLPFLTMAMALGVMWCVCWCG